jgi:hypothetical protein
LSLFLLLGFPIFQYLACRLPFSYLGANLLGSLSYFGLVPDFAGGGVATALQHAPRPTPFANHFITHSTFPIFLLLSSHFYPSQGNPAVFHLHNTHHISLLLTRRQTSQIYRFRYSINRRNCFLPTRKEALINNLHHDDHGKHHFLSLYFSCSSSLLGCCPILRHGSGLRTTGQCTGRLSRSDYTAAQLRPLGNGAASSLVHDMISCHL